MSPKTLELLSLLRTDQGADQADIDKLLAYAKCDLPQDYLDFLRLFNGAEGAIGPVFWLALWSVKQVLTLDAGYGSSKHAPGLLLIGSSLSVSAFGIDTRAKTKSEMDYVVLDFLELEWGFERHRSSTFHEFLEYLHKFQG